MNEFEIVIGSLPDMDNLVAEIYYNNLYWVQISQEQELSIRFYPHPEKQFWEFSCEEALKILNQAKEKLVLINEKDD